MNWEAGLLLIMTVGCACTFFTMFKKINERQRKYKKQMEDHYESVRRQLYSKMKYIGPNWIEEIERDFGPIKPSVKQQFYASQFSNSTKLPPVKVQRTCKPLTEKRGWKKVGNDYEGYYRTKYGSYRGHVMYLYKGVWQFMILNTPECLQNHRKRPCFISRGEQSYEVHFATKPKNVNDGIRSIENILAEAHEGRNCR